jgi:hypothetical protein
VWVRVSVVHGSMQCGICLSLSPLHRRGDATAGLCTPPVCTVVLGRTDGSPELIVLGLGPRTGLSVCINPLTPRAYRPSWPTASCDIDVM